MTLRAMKAELWRNRSRNRNVMVRCKLQMLKHVTRRAILRFALRIPVAMHRDGL